MATFMCHLLVAYKIDVAMLIWHKHILISMLTVFYVGIFFLQHELSELQEQVKMYESASRLGVGLGSNIHSDSLPHLTVRNLNKENWSTPKSQ